MKRAVLVLLVLAGCESFDSVDAKPADPDGGPSPTTDAAADASSDGAGDAGVQPFCATFVPPAGETTIYCRDFDDGTPADSAWKQVDIDPPDAAALSLSSDNVSAPSSFRARIEPTERTCSYARAMIDLGPLPATAHVSFDVRLGGEGTLATEGSSFFVIETGACGIILQANPMKGEIHAQLAAAAGDQFYDVLPAYPRASKWARVDVTLHRAENQLEISVDGVRALANPISLLAGCLTAATKLGLRPGLHCEPASTNPREVRIDNLVATGTAN